MRHCLRRLIERAGVSSTRAVLLLPILNEGTTYEGVRFRTAFVNIVGAFV